MAISGVIDLDTLDNIVQEATESMEQELRRPARQAPATQAAREVVLMFSSLLLEQIRRRY